MKKINGIGASAGIASAKVFQLVEENFSISKEKISKENVEQNITMLKKAIELSQGQIEIIKEEALKNLGKEKAEVFDAHIQILNDPEIIQSTTDLIKNNLENVVFALNETANKFIATFSALEDPYFKERSVDIKDVTSRVLRNLLGMEIKDLSSINEEVIIVAHDLTPTQTSQLNPTYVKGFLTEIGGRTSHSAILAATLEIPAVVGIGKKVFELEDGKEVLMDGSTGEVIYEPSKDDKKDFVGKQELIKEHKKELEKYINVPSRSKDGWKTEIVANIGSPKDVEGVLKFGGEGVGLFRSEFLYMDSPNWPTEEEQFQAYKEVLSKLSPRKVVIRTLDIGGDKHLSYYEFPKELNPFLGYRAIRLQLDQLDIFKTQVRALLRASAFGLLAVSVPMIATIDEFKKVRKFFEETEAELKKENVKIGKYELGIMVEVPSVVELIDKFSKYADFFSIGTNDLIQYTFAADRLSENVSYLYQPLNPTILRKIKRVIDESHKAGKWTAICGEAAGDFMLVSTFVGMHLDEFSASANLIPSLRRLVSLIDQSKAEKLVSKLLDMESQEEVKEAVKAFYKDNNIEIF